MIHLVATHFLDLEQTLKQYPGIKGAKGRTGQRVSGSINPIPIIYMVKERQVKHESLPIKVRPIATGSTFMFDLT
jgi:hypothetical protein